MNPIGPMHSKSPAPRFRRFERVSIAGESLRCAQTNGEQGTVLCLDSYYVRQEPTRPDSWMYAVHLPARGCCPTFFQSDLRSEDGFDDESLYLGQRAEISFDTVLEKTNGFAEGSYRLPGQFWQVFTFSKADVTDLACEARIWRQQTEWEHDVMGIAFRLPTAAKLDRDDILHAMSRALGHSDWVDVRGPDSLILR